MRARIFEQDLQRIQVRVHEGHAAGIRARANHPRLKVQDGLARFRVVEMTAHLDQGAAGREGSTARAGQHHAADTEVPHLAGDGRPVRFAGERRASYREMQGIAPVGTAFRGGASGLQISGHRR